MPRPVIHGRDHARGGADPIPGLIPPSGSGSWHDVINAFGATVYYPLDVFATLGGDVVTYDALPSGGPYGHLLATGDQTASEWSMEGPGAGLGSGALLTAAHFDGAAELGHRGPPPDPTYTALAGDSTTDNQLDSIFDVVHTGSSSGDSYTLTCWFRPDAIQDSAIAQILLGWGGNLSLDTPGTPGTSPAGSFGEHLVSATAYHLVYRRVSAGVTSAFYQVGSVPTNAWTFFSMSFDGDGVDGARGCRCYLNGAPVAGPTADSGDGSMIVGGTTIGNLWLGVVETSGGVDQMIYYAGGIAGVMFIPAYVAAGGHGALYQGLSLPPGGQPGLVLTTDEDGNPVWKPPPKVGVNGKVPPPTAKPAPPSSVGLIGGDAGWPVDPEAPDPWATIDQPFIWGGSSFVVQPKKWTTIPFTTPLLERSPNAAYGAGSGDDKSNFKEVPWDHDPPGTRWIDPATPRVITIPHDMSFAYLYLHMQLCLRLESPAVEATTSNRGLRIFETTHQKTLLSDVDRRDICVVDDGAFDTYRDTQAHALTTDGVGLFATGGLAFQTGSPHGNFMFAGAGGYSEDGNTWLPGNYFDNPTSTTGPMLKKGMKLIAQCWHDASVPLTFHCDGTFPYRPNMQVSAPCFADWGEPWASWDGTL